MTEQHEDLPLSENDIEDIRGCDLSRLDLSPTGLEHLCDQAILAHAYKAALVEAIAAKERAEAERDEALSEQKWAEEVADGYCRRLIVADAEVTRLTAALASTREEAIRECIEIVQAHERHIDTKGCVSCILDQLNALSHPTTEPAKAEEER